MADGTSTRVFISYSRKDIDFAESLRSKLADDGFDAYMDVEDIVKGEPWQERLQELIESADAIIFLVSPGSVQSKICDWEINEAEMLGKRILPVVCRQTDNDVIPQRLRRLNYTFLEKETKYKEEYPKLLASLREDAVLVREHTHIGELARRWQRESRSDHLLLRGPDIQAAETWRDTVSSTSIEPTKLHLEYIANSRRKAAQRLYRWIYGSIAVAVMAITLAVFAFYQQREAVTQRGIAENQRDVANKRAAMMSVDTAQKLIEKGSRDASLLLMMDATHAFTPEDMPDKIILGLEDAIANAHKRRSLRLSPKSRVFTHAHRILAQDGDSGELMYISSAGVKQSLGKIENKVIAASNNNDGENYLILTSDHTLTEINPETKAHKTFATFNPTGLTNELINLANKGLKLAKIEKVSSGVYFTSSSGETAHNGKYGKFVLILDINRKLAATVFFKSDLTWMSRHSYLKHVTNESDGSMIFMDFPQRAAFQVNPDLTVLQPLTKVDSIPDDFIPCEEVGNNPSFNQAMDREFFIEQDAYLYGYTECYYSDRNVTIMYTSSSGSGGTFPWFELYNKRITDNPKTAIDVGTKYQEYHESFMHEVNWVAPSPSGGHYLISHERKLIEENKRSAKEIGELAQIPETGVYLSDDIFAAVLPDAEGVTIDIFSSKGQLERARDASNLVFGQYNLLHPDGCETFFGNTKLLRQEHKIIDGDISIFARSLNGAVEFISRTKSGKTINKQKIILDKVRCYRFSPDYRHLLLYNSKEVSILNANDFVNGKGPIRKLQLVKTGFINSAHFLPGQEYDFLTTNATPVIYRWTFDTQKKIFLKTIYYQGERDIFGAEPDRYAKRLIITEHLGARNFRTFLYSIEADRFIRHLASDYKFAYLASFLTDGRIMFGHSRAISKRRSIEGDYEFLIIDPPDVTKLYNEAMSLLPDRCLPTKKNDLSSSPCWHKK